MKYRHDLSYREAAAQDFGGVWTHCGAVFEEQVRIFYCADAEVVFGAEVFDGGG